MNSNSKFYLVAAVVQALALTLRADVLELKNGQVLNGKYLGGSATSVAFDPGTGPQNIPTSEAASLKFTAPAPAPAAAATPAAAPAAAGATTASIPAGTVLLVRMVDGVSSRDAKGKRFTAALESDLTAGGNVVVRAGTKIYGRVESAQQARRFAGQSQLDIRLTEIAAGGALVPVLTGPFAQAGARSGGKTARGAAAGAAIGAIADGGDGAAKGAAIGAVASGLKRGETVSIAPGTLLEFQVLQPVTLNL